MVADHVVMLARQLAEMVEHNMSFSSVALMQKLNDFSNLGVTLDRHVWSGMAGDVEREFPAWFHEFCAARGGLLWVKMTPDTATMRNGRGSYQWTQGTCVLRDGHVLTVLLGARSVPGVGHTADAKKNELTMVLARYARSFEGFEGRHFPWLACLDSDGDAAQAKAVRDTAGEVGREGIVTKGSALPPALHDQTAVWRAAAALQPSMGGLRTPRRADSEGRDSGLRGGGVRSGALRSPGPQLFHRGSSENRSTTSDGAQGRSTTFPSERPFS
jgi:hypothetical protein